MPTKNKAKDQTLSEPPQVLSFLNSLGVSPQELVAVAKESGWHDRAPRKITSAGLLAALCQETVAGTPSFNDVAAAVDGDSKSVPSKQAIDKRMNQPCLEMLKAVLKDAIGKRIRTDVDRKNGTLFEKYGRVLVQDSTVLKLPSWLFEEFSGVANQSGRTCHARIQAVYDLRNMVFVAFSIDTYSENDLAVASKLELQKNDLVLRDRGYLTRDEITRHVDALADFIYRHKTGTIYLDPETKEALDLAGILRHEGRIDRQVMLNDGSETCVRLVASPVSEETAALRRMKAKKEVKGRNPSKAVLELMGWTIFITSLCEEVSFGEVLEIYGLRWRIEVIFKAWKSNMSFDVIHRVSALEFRIHITARLIMITVGTGHLYKLCYQRIRELTGRDLSLMKFSKYLANNPARLERICAWLANGALLEEPTSTCQALRKYCCYDKRKRQNYHEKQRAISLS